VLDRAVGEASAAADDGMDGYQIRWLAARECELRAAACLTGRSRGFSTGCFFVRNDQERNAAAAGWWMDGFLCIMSPSTASHYSGHSLPPSSTLLAIQTKRPCQPASTIVHQTTKNGAGRTRGLAATKRSHAATACLDDSSVHRDPGLLDKLHVSPIVSTPHHQPSCVARLSQCGYRAEPTTAPIVRPAGSLGAPSNRGLHAVWALTRPLTRMPLASAPAGMPLPVTDARMPVRCGHDDDDDDAARMHSPSLPSWRPPLLPSTSGLYSSTEPPRSTAGTLRLPACSGPQSGWTDGLANGCPCSC